MAIYFDMLSSKQFKFSLEYNFLKQKYEVNVKNVLDRSECDCL